MLFSKGKSGWSPTAYARDKYMTERTSYTFNDISISQPILTKDGAKWIYDKYLKGELPMKKAWMVSLVMSCLKIRRNNFKESSVALFFLPATNSQTPSNLLSEALSQELSLSLYNHLTENKTLLVRPPMRSK